MMWQGLFQSCKATKLSEICVKYAKSKEKEQIEYFQKDAHQAGENTFLKFNSSKIGEIHS